jgi:Zn-dependent peptidase ImmA (M78 family)
MLMREQREIIKAHQKSAPVVVTAVAEALGLEVFTVSDWPNTVSGMLRRVDGDAYKIYVNGNHPVVRRRFTIAHEIGHFVLHKHLLKDGIVEDYLLRAEGFPSSTEAQANAFAADLLMPWHLIEAGQAAGHKTIESLAEYLNVSKDAMSVRLLGIPYARAAELGAA